MNWITGGPSKCPRDEKTGEVVDGPTGATTVFFLLVFVVFLWDVWGLLRAGYFLVQEKGYGHRAVLALLVAVLSFQTVGVTLYFLRYRNCRAVSGFVICMVMWVLSLSFGSWILLGIIRQWLKSDYELDVLQQVPEPPTMLRMI